MLGELDTIETILFCDETKFYLNDGDAEDAIYYFAIPVLKEKIPQINHEFEKIMENFRIQASVFHATKIFRERSPQSRIQMIYELKDWIIRHRIHCLAYKYEKEIFFKASKLLAYLNNNILNFNNPEFQALFYFLIVLNTYLRDENPNFLKRELFLFFDRNVYGIKDIESFNFPVKHFVLKQMTFTEKSKISLLALPDFLGYLFRKTKQSHNKVQLGNNSIESSILTIACYQSMSDICNAGLFRFLEVKEDNLKKALNI